MLAVHIVVIMLVAGLFFVPIGLAFKHGRSIKRTKNDCKDKNPVNRHLRAIDRQLRSAPEFGARGVWITEFYSATLHAFMPLGIFAALLTAPFFFDLSASFRVWCCSLTFGAAAACYLYYGWVGYKRFRYRKHRQKI
ncbi:hypothetical protein [Paraburkholderia aspalathi]|uniref:hypothetical protein n=1 Tax=Paraburkholderia aspalathi TaxID=1324617 RepID=UPI0038B7C902